MKGYARILTVLICGVFLSALAVTYAKHQSRRLFIELQALNTERDNLEIEWGRLQLEQSTWAAPNRIEEIAHQRLQMQLPQAEKIVIISP
ncbi:MAG: cell division protein FtsL [Gammaproteobacteria bacterium]|nr:cell division protein FtsL [Gammaproteobacteria bacterium]